MTYIRSLPLRDSVPAAFQLPLAVRLLHGADQILDAAAKIDHTIPPQQPVAVSDAVATGRYVAQTCMGCHGAQLGGGPRQFQRRCGQRDAPMCRRAGFQHLGSQRHAPRRQPRGAADADQSPPGRR